MMSTKLFAIIFLIYLLPETLAESHTPKCPCEDAQQCNNIYNWDQNKKEVIIADSADTATSFKEWIWDSFTTVLTINDGEQSDLMCYAHSKGKKYGFMLKSISEVYTNATPLEVYINVTVTDVQMKFADVLALDLLELLGDCNNAGQHVTPIKNVVTGVIKGVKAKLPKLKVICAMPWKPPCYDNDCAIGPAFAQVCDAVLLSPESYHSYCDQACIAKATVPFTKLTLGITEYLAVGFNESQIIIGIPWHGYEYTCDKAETVGSQPFQRAHVICYLKKSTKTNSTEEFCDYEGSRKKVTLGPIFHQHPSLVYTQSTYSMADQAPWTYKVVNNTVNNTIQGSLMWFEDIGSLEAKYELVEHYSLKGCMIYTGDDLMYNMDTGDDFNTNMWSWVLHSILVSGTSTHQVTKLNYAATAAGVGVGMFLFGCLLGTIASCIFFRRKRILRPPFSHDKVPSDEFHDDDNAL